MPDTEKDTPETLEFREKQAELNGTRRRPEPRSAPRRPAADELSVEDTVRMEHLVAQVRSAVAEDVWEQVHAQARQQQRALPLAGTGALVLVVLILAALLAWLGYLWITHGGV